MKSLVIVAVVLSIGLAQDNQHRYACPEVDVDFGDFGVIGVPIPNVLSWEDCGMFQ